MESTSDTVFVFEREISDFILSRGEEIGEEDLEEVVEEGKEREPDSSGSGMVSDGVLEFAEVVITAAAARGDKMGDVGL